MEIKNNNKVFGKIEGDKIIFTNGLDLNELISEHAGVIHAEKEGDKIIFIKEEPTIEDKIIFLKGLGFEVN